MIKVLLGGDDKQQVMILGITKENLAMLQRGMPLTIMLKDVGLPNVRLALTYGDTQADILKDIKDHLGVEIVLDREPGPGEEFRFPPKA